MTATAIRPRKEPVDDGDSGNSSADKRLKISFSGSSLVAIRKSSSIDGVNPADFVRRAIRLAIYLQKMQRRGYTVIARNEEGAEFVLPPDLVSA